MIIEHDVCGAQIAARRHIYRTAARLPHAILKREHLERQIHALLHIKNVSAGLRVDDAAARIRSSACD